MRREVVSDGTVSANNFSFPPHGPGIQDLGKKTHLLPGDWWNVFAPFFRYDRTH